MSEFRIHQAESSNILKSIADQVGFLPNVFGVLGGNPKALEAFATLNVLFGDSSLNPIEREIVQAAASVVNSCEYCVAGHTAFTNFQNLDNSLIEAVRAGTPLDDARFEALRQFTQAIVVSKGRDAKTELQAFLAAGYTRQQVFDVVLGISVKMFSNQVVGLTELPLDETFKPFRWNSNQSVAAAA